MPAHILTAQALLILSRQGRQVKITLTFNRWVFICRKYNISLIMLDMNSKDSDLQSVKAVLSVQYCAKRAVVPEI